MSRFCGPFDGMTLGGGKTLIVEPWFDSFDAALTTTEAETRANARWIYGLDMDAAATTPAPAIALVDPSSDGQASFNYVKLVGSTAAGTILSWLKTSRAIGRATADAVLHMSVKVRLPASSGLTAIVQLAPDANELVYGQLSSVGGANWHARVLDNETTALASTDTGVAPTAQWQRIDIRYEAASGLWSFFIEGVLVASVTYAGITDYLRVVFTIVSTAATPAPQFDVGPVEMLATW